jgi:hypothetical protein
MLSTRHLKNVFFRILPFSLVSISATICLINGSFHHRPSGIATHEPKFLAPSLFHVGARQVDFPGVTGCKKAFNPSETAVYRDVWRSHWCTYSNNREFFFLPRINETVQHIRVIGFPVATFRWERTPERTACDTIARESDTPGFFAPCSYHDQSGWGKYRDHHLTKDIHVTEGDYLVQNFKIKAMSFVGLDARTVLVLGQHTNIC